VVAPSFRKTVYEGVGVGVQKKQSDMHLFFAQLSQLCGYQMQGVGAANIHGNGHLVLLGLVF